MSIICTYMNGTIPLRRWIMANCFSMFVSGLLKDPLLGLEMNFGFP